MVMANYNEAPFCGQIKRVKLTAGSGGGNDHKLLLLAGGLSKVAFVPVSYAVCATNGFSWGLKNGGKWVLSIKLELMVIYAYF